MPKLEEIFDRIKKNKKKQSEIRSTYKDTLSNSHEYSEIQEKIKILKEKKKKIEDDVKSDFSNDFSRLEDLKLDVETDKELMNDIAINSLVKGEPIELVDQYDNQYEPIFNVKFKKI